MLELEYAPGKKHRFTLAPFPHQEKEFFTTRETLNWALLWDQGTGKSKLIVDTANWLFQKGLIDAVLVVAPGGVHTNWVENEIPDHTHPDLLRSVTALAYQSKKSSTKWHQKAMAQLIKKEGLIWLTTTYSAFTTKQSKKTLINLFENRCVLYVLDEAHSIKSPDTAVTQSILKSAKYAPYRRILTGTPITQGPFDAYSQVKFLDENYWNSFGLGTYTEFKAHFAVMGKVRNKNIKRALNPATGRWEKCGPKGALVDIVKGYKNLDELHEMLKPISSRVTKDVVLPGLPQKLYQRRTFEMTDEQVRIYRELRDEYLTWLEKEEEEQEVEAAESAQKCDACQGSGEVEEEGFIYTCPSCGGQALEESGILVSAELAIVRMMRLQQVTCGYLPTTEPGLPMYEIEGPNRRLDLACEIVQNTAGKIIIWARFQLDITLMMQAFKKRGITAVRYDGQVSPEDRLDSIARLKGVRAVYENGQVVGKEPVPEEQQAKVFIANPAAGATGLTLTEAKTVIYYSNSYKLVDRLQSEDRNHRIGQKNNVLYIDLCAENTQDEHIISALRDKLDIATQITGDRLKEWI